jgi:hypothetical protein
MSDFECLPCLLHEAEPMLCGDVSRRNARCKVVSPASGAGGGEECDSQPYGVSRPLPGQRGR